MSQWFAGALAGLCVWLLVARVDPPRRFPEDTTEPEHGSSRPSADRPPPRGAGATWVRRSVEAPLSDLATVCDLLAVAAASGCTVVEAVDAVGGSGTGPVSAALARTARDVRVGRRFSDALSSVVPTLGAASRPMVTTLLSAASSGAPAAPALQRLADAERRRRRRRVESRIRRLPVLLLVPLVGCILPAFVALTLVPAGIAVTRDVQLPTARPTFPRPHADPGRPTAEDRPTGGPP